MCSRLQWINCTRGGSGVDGRDVQIISAKNSALISRNSMTATIWSDRNLRNSLYYCSNGQAPRHYISLFLKNSSKCIIYRKPLLNFAYLNTVWNLIFAVLYNFCGSTAIHGSSVPRKFKPTLTGLGSEWSPFDEQ